MSDPGERDDRPSHHDRLYHHADLPDGVDPVGVPADDADYRSLVIALAVLAVCLVLCTTVGWIAYHHFTR